MQEPMSPILAKLDQLQAQLTALTTQQQRREERFDESIADATALAHVAMAAGTERLDQLERDGTFDKLRELFGVGRQILAGFSAEEVRDLGASVVTILEAVKALTQPAVLAVATDAAAALEHAGEVKPIGIFGVVKATRDVDVQKGMAVLFEVLRRVGRAAGAASERASVLEGKQAKLAEVLGSRRRALNGERPKLLASGAAPKPAKAAAPPPAARPAPAAAGATCAAPAKAQPTAVVLDGIAYGPDGHLVDAAAWTRPLAEQLAALQGVTLTDAHWRVLETARAEFLATGVSPNIRRLTEVAGVTTKDLYQLFPKAPGRTLAKIAGLPKPGGCL